MQGKIIKGIAGSYIVFTNKENVFECKPKGIFRYKKIKPLVGDDCVLEEINEEKHTAVIADILDRKNELIRPQVANVDQAFIVMAARDPEPNTGLLDRFLIFMERQKVPVTICISKTDLSEENKIDELKNIYSSGGYKVLLFSVKEKTGLSEIIKSIEGKTTVLCGTSGVGKSSLVNELQEEVLMETGSLSEKIKRGKNTTRHTELIAVNNNTFILDTPGFSSLDISILGIEAGDIKYYFPEFEEYEDNCRFRGCVHENEPGCAVKDAVACGKIKKERYNSYIQIYHDLKNVKKY